MLGPRPADFECEDEQFGLLLMALWGRGRYSRVGMGDGRETFRLEGGD